MPENLAEASPSRKLEVLFQIDVEAQRRIGTLIVMFSMIEMYLELAIWTLSGEVLTSSPPTTDKMPASELIKRLREVSDAIGDEAIRTQLLVLLDAADDLLAVRNTIAHGRPRAAGQFPGPGSLLRNASWLGETRRREAATLVVDPGDLDVSAEVADTIFSVIGWTCIVATNDTIDRQAVLGLGDLVKRRRKQIAEIRGRMVPE